MAKEARKGSLTGLTEEEAMEFNNWMIRGFLVFIVFAVVAHLLVWFWKPWFGDHDPGQFGGTSSVQLIESGEELV